MNHCLVGIGVALFLFCTDVLQQAAKDPADPVITGQVNVHTQLIQRVIQRLSGNGFILQHRHRHVVKVMNNAHRIDGRQIRQGGLIRSQQGGQAGLIHPVGQLQFALKYTLIRLHRTIAADFLRRIAYGFQLFGTQIKIFQRHIQRNIQTGFLGIADAKHCIKELSAQERGVVDAALSYNDRVVFRSDHRTGKLQLHDVAIFADDFSDGIQTEAAVQGSIYDGLQMHGIVLEEGLSVKADVGDTGIQQALADGCHQLSFQLHSLGAEPQNHGELALAVLYRNKGSDQAGLTTSDKC